MRSPRVVSLLPSATEIVATLDAEALLVGRSEECDFPPSVRQLPVVMRARTLDRNAASREIDARVSTARAQKESLYSLDLDLLRELRPDLILTQDLCGVCSVTDAEVQDACRTAGVKSEILSLNPRRLRDVSASVVEIGRAIGRRSAAEAVARHLRHRASTGGTVPGKRVAVVEWVDPPILAGLWVPDMVAQAGGLPYGPHPGAHGERTSWNALADAELDLVVVSPCSFGVERTLQELRGLEAKVGRGASAVEGAWIADEAYFSRPGPRLADGVELLRRLTRNQTVEGLPMAAVRYTESSGG